MTREDKIKEAYKAYMDNGGMLQSNLWFAFKAGAEWADNNPNLESIWHDASEEPQHNNKQIMSYSEAFDYFFIDFPNYLMVKDGGQDKDWETAVLRNKISKWAYISDLLPKN